MTQCKWRRLKRGQQQIKMAAPSLWVNGGVHGAVIQYPLFTLFAQEGCILASAQLDKTSGAHMRFTDTIGHRATTDLTCSGVNDVIISSIKVCTEREQPIITGLPNRALGALSSCRVSLQPQL